MTVAELIQQLKNIHEDMTDAEVVIKTSRFKIRKIKDIYYDSFRQVKIELEEEEGD